MKDPYSVLGVSRNASVEDIKLAYRELARKYHPDNYVGNDLADLAEEKMKEINDAYDAILREREGGGSAGSYTGPSSGGGGVYSQIRLNIMNGNIQEAERLLNAQNDRSAEWYFCMGSIFYKRGWYDEARRHFAQAVNMNPGNPEYRHALNQLSSNPMSGGYNRGGGLSVCDCCAAAICADCLCNGC